MESWANRASRLCLLLPLALALMALLVARPAWGTATSDSTAEDTSEESGGPDDSRFGLDTLRPAQGIRQKVKLFIGIPSLHTNLEQRQAARDTWIGIAKATQVAVRFFGYVQMDDKVAVRHVIYVDKDDEAYSLIQQLKEEHSIAVRFFIYIEKEDEAWSLMQQLKEEHSAHHDTVLLTPEVMGAPALEAQAEASRVTRMMMCMFETTVKHYDTEYIMRADDDSYLNIPVIMHMLQQQRAEGPGRAFWFGYAIPGIIIDPRIEGRLPKYKTLMEDNVHQPIVPQYMASAGSIMSTKVAEAVVVAHHTVGLRMLPDDSEAVGLWLAAFDIHYLNESEAGCSVRPFPPIQEGKEEMEWDAAETEAFCLNSDMPLAVVHPCKSPEVIHKVFEAATGCQDTLTHSRYRKQNLQTKTAQIREESLQDSDKT